VKQWRKRPSLVSSTQQHTRSSKAFRRWTRDAGERGCASTVIRTPRNEAVDEMGTHTPGERFLMNPCSLACSKAPKAEQSASNLVWPASVCSWRTAPFPAATCKPEAITPLPGGRSAATAQANQEAGMSTQTNLTQLRSVCVQLLRPLPAPSNAVREREREGERAGSVGIKGRPGRLARAVMNTCFPLSVGLRFLGMPSGARALQLVTGAALWKQ